MIAGETDEVARWTAQQQLAESRALAGRLVTQWNEAAPDKDAFADTLGRNLTQAEVALLPEDIRARVTDRAVLRQLHDVLAPAVTRGDANPIRASGPTTDEGQRAVAIIDRFLADTPATDRRRIAAMMTSIHTGLGVDEQWLLPRATLERLRTEAEYTPTTPAGTAPRTIADPRSRELAARLAVGTDDARADVAALSMRWYNEDMGFHRGELVDGLARNLTPQEIAQLPAEIRRSISDRALLRQMRENLAVDAPADPANLQLALGRRAAAEALRLFLAESPTADRQRIAYLLNREISLGEKFLLPRELTDQLEALARQR